jgi:hypothetical protein
VTRRENPPEKILCRRIAMGLIQPFEAHWVKGLKFVNERVALRFHPASAASGRARPWECWLSSPKECPLARSSFSKRRRARCRRIENAAALQPRTFAASRGSRPSHATRVSTSRSERRRDLNAVANASRSAISSGMAVPGSGVSIACESLGCASPRRLTVRRLLRRTFRAVLKIHGRGSCGTDSSRRQTIRKISETTSSAEARSSVRRSA